MPSICGRYSAALLLSLNVDERGGLLLAYFRSLPTAGRAFAERCIRHAVRACPEPERDALLAALLDSWAWLERQGLLTPPSVSSTGQSGCRTGSSTKILNAA